MRVYPAIPALIFTKSICLDIVRSRVKIMCEYSYRLVLRNAIIEVYACLAMHDAYSKYIDILWLNL